VLILKHPAPYCCILHSTVLHFQQFPTRKNWHGTFKEDPCFLNAKVHTDAPSKIMTLLELLTGACGEALLTAASFMVGFSGWPVARSGCWDSTFASFKFDGPKPMLNGTRYQDLFSRQRHFQSPSQQNACQLTATSLDRQKAPRCNWRPQLQTASTGH